LINAVISEVIRLINVVQVIKDLKEWGSSLGLHMAMSMSEGPREQQKHHPDQGI
jgi:hypothetical protein